MNNLILGQFYINFSSLMDALVQQAIIVFVAGIIFRIAYTNTTTSGASLSLNIIILTNSALA